MTGELQLIAVTERLAPSNVVDSPRLNTPGVLLPHEPSAVVRHRPVPVVRETVCVVRAARRLQGILERQEVAREASAGSWSSRAVKAFYRLPRAVITLRLPGVGQSRLRGAER